MKKQRWNESERRRTEERRSEKRKRHRKEDAGGRKGRKVTKHRVSSNDLWSGRSKSRLAKAVGTEPAGQMGSEKLRCRKRVRGFGAKHISKSKV